MKVYSTLHILRAESEEEKNKCKIKYRCKWRWGSKKQFPFLHLPPIFLLMGLFVYFKDILPFSHFVCDEKFIRRRQTTQDENF